MRVDGGVTYLEGAYIPCITLSALALPISSIEGQTQRGERCEGSA